MRSSRSSRTIVPWSFENFTHCRARSPRLTTTKPVSEPPGVPLVAIQTGFFPTVIRPASLIPAASTLKLSSVPSWQPMKARAFSPPVVRAKTLTGLGTSTSPITTGFSDGSASKVQGHCFGLGPRSRVFTQPSLLPQ
jgi:hypothetical protein